MARKIAALEPVLAKRILDAPMDLAGTRELRALSGGRELLNYAHLDGRPVTVYRGALVSAAEFDPRFKSARGSLFTSEDVRQAHEYALGGHLTRHREEIARGEKTEGVLVELVVPSFTLFYEGYPVIDQGQLPDQTAFISRAAIVDLSGGQAHAARQPLVWSSELP